MLCNGWGIAELLLACLLNNITMTTNPAHIAIKETMDKSEMAIMEFYTGLGTNKNKGINKKQ